MNASKRVPGRLGAESMTKQRLDSLWAYAVIGMVSPLPLVLIYAAIVALALLSNWPEWMGPVVGIPCWLSVAWGGSLLSGWACRRLLADRPSLLAPLLANSGGWVVLAFLGMGSASGMFGAEFGVSILVVLVAATVWYVGFLITRAAMRRQEMESSGGKP